MSKFKIGDRIQCSTYGGGTIVNYFPTEEVPESCVYYQICFDKGIMACLASEKIEASIPTLVEIKNNKLTCYINVKSRDQAIQLQDALKCAYGNGTYVIETWDEYIGRNAKYENGIAYSIEKGIINGFCYADYYKNCPEIYGEGYEFEDILQESHISAASSLIKEDNKVKFNVGDKVIGNNEASKNYGITRQGWCGIVTAIYKETMEVRGTGLGGDEQTFMVRQNCFDLIDENVSYGTNNFRFITTENVRYVSHGKHKGETIPTVTTTVFDDSVGKMGTATCDKADYNERQGIIEAIANMTYGNFDREYNKFLNQRKRINDILCKCSICGKSFETKEEARTCEQAHIDRKKAKREKYIIRAEAKKRAREMKIEQMAKDMLKEGKV